MGIQSRPSRAGLTVLLATFAGAAAAITVLVWVTPRHRPQSNPPVAVTPAPAVALPPKPVPAPVVHTIAPPVVEAVRPVESPSEPTLTQLRAPTIANLPEDVHKPTDAEAAALRCAEIDIPPELVCKAPETDAATPPPGIDNRSAPLGSTPSGSGDPLFPQPNEGADWAAQPGLRLSSQFSLYGGNEAANSGAFSLPRTSDEPALPPAPDPGSGMAMKVNDWSQFRASTLTQMPGTDNQIFELRLENVWRLTPDSTFSLGYQHLRSVFPDQVQQSLIKRDAMLIEYRIGF